MGCKLSIIIPVFDAEKFLERCLDSVVNQTLRDIEIICVDDESTDSSLNILKKYASKDKRIKIISQKNQGQGSARNRGLSMAVGDYCGFVDSDDWIDANYFETLYNKAVAYDADIACCSVNREYASGKIRVKIKIEKEELLTSVREKFAVADMPNNCLVYNKIYRRSALKQYNVKFPEKVYFEDMPFCLDAVYYLKRMVAVPGITYHYWVNNNSTTRNMNDIIRQDRLKAQNYLIDFSRKHHIVLPEKNYIKKKKIYDVCGFPLLKIYEWETKKEYLLFGGIRILRKTVRI